jgi:activator of 2-hydroxyglutaryl-CoA dehydratase
MWRCPDVKTEISCHAKGCFHYFPQAITVIDIGGQDNKIIKLDAEGHRLNFRMNRKCAAGTGAFLEEMSLRLDIPLEAMDALARESTPDGGAGQLLYGFYGNRGSGKNPDGEKVPDIIKGLFMSVIKRIMEMETLTGPVAMTGGVGCS